MSRTRVALDTIQVASPCPVSWEGMAGDGRVRYCTRCEQRVYDLSSLSREKAEALINQAEGRLCVRFYRRPDGTVMTSDCPVGVAAWRTRMAVVVGSIAAAFLLLVTWAAMLVGARGLGDPMPRGAWFNPIQAIQDWINPPMIMGGPCVPPHPRRRPPTA